MTRHDQAAMRPGSDTAPLIEGPRWYRRRIRMLGPIFGLVPMFVLGAVALVSLEFFDGRLSGLIGLFAGTAAAPGLLVAGAPFGDEANYPLAVLASVPLWLLLGWIAAVRATRRPVASWTDYTRELLYLTIAVALGASAALLVATAVVGESLIV